MYKISTEKLPELWRALAEGRELYAPIDKGGVTGFHLWTEGARVKLDRLNTVKSPKDAFFPQSENMARFKVEGKAISVEAQLPEERTAVYFGVRACDARSFDILDAVFLSDPADAYYKARRENGIIVTLGLAQRLRRPASAPPLASTPPRRRGTCAARCAGTPSSGNP